MGESERIVFKKFYVGRVSLFGLYYGAFLGLFVAFVLFFIILLSSQAELFFQRWFNVEGISLAFMIGVISFVVIAVLVLFSFILFSLSYNLISRMGGDIQFDLSGTDTVEPSSTFQSSGLKSEELQGGVKEGEKKEIRMPLSVSMKNGNLQNRPGVANHFGEGVV